MKIFLSISLEHSMNEVERSNLSSDKFYCYRDHLFYVQHEKGGK